MAHRYEVGNPLLPEGTERMRRMVAQKGLALFDGASDADDLRRAASAVMVPYRHPDSAQDGVTTITDRGANGDLPNAAGFSRRGLLLHTDRSGVPEPPALLMTACGEGRFSGGACLLADGLAVYRASLERHTIAVTLAEGQGYLLDNRRWVHGRRPYAGQRTLYRVLGDPLPGTGIDSGIPLVRTLRARFSAAGAG